MIILNALKSGLSRTVKLWKGVLIVWCFSLLLISLLALPMKGALKAGLGKSMITEQMMDGMNIEVISDMGPTLKIMMSYFSSGLLILILAGILLNAFLTGGLFNFLKGTSIKFSGTEFFRASAKNFWSFLVISLIISLILLILIFVIIGIPISLISQSQTIPETTAFVIAIASGIIFLLLAAVLLLVADYARAWQVINEDPACFKALGFGFGNTFGNFLSSFPLMVIILLVQILFAYLIYKIIGNWIPVKGVGVFLLFVISQLMFYVKLLLKTGRYASVTSLMEQNILKLPPEKISDRVEKEPQPLKLTEDIISIMDDLG